MLIFIFVLNFYIGIYIFSKFIFNTIVKGGSFYEYNSS